MARILRTSSKPAPPPVPPLPDDPELVRLAEQERLLAQLDEVHNQLLLYSMDIHNGKLRADTIRYIRERQDRLVERWAFLDCRYRCELPA